ncbi:acetyl-CoA carboxylase carboxyl transferase subunit alpha, partial [Staphylococcus felis]
NRLLMLENSTYSVISPEGAAGILWKDSSLAKIAAETMKITAYDLQELNIADKVVKEPLGGAHHDVEMLAKQIKKEFVAQLKDFMHMEPIDIKEDRFNKFRNIGTFVE